MAIKYHNPKTRLARRQVQPRRRDAGRRPLSLRLRAGRRRFARQAAAGFEKQAVQVWKNIGQVLKAGGMGYKDIVKMTTFLTDTRFVGPTARCATSSSSAPYPASTLLIVAGLADPAMLVEIEVMAAK